MRIGTCVDCGNEFPHEKVKGFLPKRCVACQREFGNDRMRRWRETHPERTREIYQKSNLKRLADPEHRRSKREGEARRRYGIEPDQLRELLKAQDGKCAICGYEPPDMDYSLPLPRGSSSPGLHVDHCHKTGRVRGLLCGPCNTALGSFKDSPTALLAAIEYLTRF